MIASINPGLRASYVSQREPVDVQSAPSSVFPKYRCLPSTWLSYCFFGLLVYIKWVRSITFNYFLTNACPIFFRHHFLFVNFSSQPTAIFPSSFKCVCQSFSSSPLWDANWLTISSFTPPTPLRPTYRSLPDTITPPPLSLQDNNMAACLTSPYHIFWPSAERDHSRTQSTTVSS